MIARVNIIGGKASQVSSMQLYQEQIDLGKFGAVLSSPTELLGGKVP